MTNRMMLFALNDCEVGQVKGFMLDHKKCCGGDFDSADVYETIKESIGDSVLNLRPSFKPDKVLEEERIIDENKILDPRTLLQKRVREKYGKEEVNKLSIDLLDNLSVGRIDDAKFISDRFYSQHYFDEAF